MTTQIISTSPTAGDLSPSLTLAITSKAKAMIAAGENVISMCAGEPDFDTPEVIKQAAIKAIQAGDTKYTPAAGRLDLRQALSKKFKVDNNLNYEPTQIVVAPGGKFSLMSVIQVLCSAGDEVIIPTPSWLSYPEMVKTTGATSVFVETTVENNYCLDMPALEKAVTSKTKLLILNSPSNPIGNVYSKELLQQIGELAVRKNFMIISDEMYEKLVYDKGSEHHSIASFSPEIYERTVTINGFSKAYSMTGWRLGFLGAPKWLASKISALQSHATSNPTSFAQAGAIAALENSATEVEEMRLAFKKRRDLIFKLLSDIPGLKTLEPKGAFYIFPDISSFGLESMEFAARILEEKKLAVIPGTPFGAPNNIRLSYACSEENITEAAKRLKEFCASL